MNISAAVQQLTKYGLNPVYFGDDFGSGEERIICFLKMAEGVADRFAIYQENKRWRAAVLRCTPLSRQKKGQLISGFFSFQRIDMGGCVISQRLMEASGVVKLEIFAEIGSRLAR